MSVSLIDSRVCGTYLLVQDGNPLNLINWYLIEVWFGFYVFQHVSELYLRIFEQREREGSVKTWI